MLAHPIFRDKSANVSAAKYDFRGDSEERHNCAFPGLYEFRGKSAKVSAALAGIDLRCVSAESVALAAKICVFRSECAEVSAG